MLAAFPVRDALRHVVLAYNRTIFLPAVAAAVAIYLVSNVALSLPWHAHKDDDDRRPWSEFMRRVPVFLLALVHGLFGFQI